MKSLLTVIVFLITVVNVYPQDTCVQYDSFEGLAISSVYKSTPLNIGPIGQKEISGIVPSIKYPGFFWAIGDSGTGAVLYLYSLKDASLKAIFILQGVSNVDWEDLAIAQDESGQGILYIPDFGDNKAKRKSYNIYAISEPDEPQDKINNIFVNPESIRYIYDNGPRDAEALAVDPTDRTLYVITKREKEVFVYPAYMKESDSIQTLSPIGNLPINNVVAADFSSDGLKFFVKTYTNIYLWERTSTEESFCSMMGRKPVNIPYQLEPQGESICFTEGGFVTLSEERFDIKPQLYFYPLTD